MTCLTLSAHHAQRQGSSLQVRMTLLFCTPKALYEIGTRNLCIFFARSQTATLQCSFSCTPCTPDPWGCGEPQWSLSELRQNYLPGQSLLQNWGISNIRGVTKKTLLYCFKVAHTSLPSIIKKEENNAYVAVGCYITHQVVGKAVRISLK